MSDHADGERHLVVHLVLDGAKETRLFLGRVTTFVKDSKNLGQTV